ncbi:MAG: Gfo/Idh/MocA family oxidoreductase, partial [Halobacteriales archaeon]|nr:Gfo/Idh/MocA family oxidoreductase [Halobacteriales archaeon]
MQFGILGTAAIARNHVIPAIDATDHEILAIASRDPDRAAAMAADFDIPRSYGSYEALLEDPDLDAIYNPLPNSMHEEWTIKTAEAGYPILCEKPLATDA